MSAADDPTAESEETAPWGHNSMGNPIRTKACAEQQTESDHALITRIREAIDRDESAVRAEIGRVRAPSGWLGPLLDTHEAHRRLLTLAEDYTPELEHGDNGEWAFGEVVSVLAGLYLEDHHREPCGNHCSCGAVVKTDDAFAQHVAEVTSPTGQSTGGDPA